MRKFLVSAKKQDGFTLVELMVVVAIIGLLSAVAIPNFKKYQAKSKISEAKLQLSALYTAETAFFSDYNMYAACLRYMGFDPNPEMNNRYYAVGFFANIGDRDNTANTAAVNSGMKDDAASCPDSVAVVDGNVSATNEATVFPAGKGIGAAVMTVAIGAGNNANVAVACNEATIAAAANTGSCMGTQVGGAPGASTMVFQAAAVGYISGDFVAADGSNASGLNINHNKMIKSVVNGY